MTDLHDHRPSLGAAGQDCGQLIMAMTSAALEWIEQLDVRQRQIAVYDFADPERGDWHYAPRQRNGLPLKAMTAKQRSGACRLLETALSAEGQKKAHAIMALESVLGDLENHTRDRDPLNYAFTLFGDPRRHPWGWRVEGHHLIINVTVAGQLDLAITPTFWGSNPACIPHGAQAGHRIQALEYRLALELAQSLDTGQRQQAIFAEESVGNIIAERTRARLLTTPKGLRFTDLSEGQRQLAMTLINAHVGNAADPIGRPYLERVKADGLEQLHLAWAGGAHEGTAFYYRFHAPRLLVEFDCTQNDANHIHSLWRDPTNDWGRDILGEHYQHHHDDD